MTEISKIRNAEEKTRHHFIKNAWYNIEDQQKEFASEGIISIDFTIEDELMVINWFGLKRT